MKIRKDCRAKKGADREDLGEKAKEEERELEIEMLSGK